MERDYRGVSVSIADRALPRRVHTLCGGIVLAGHDAGLQDAEYRGGLILVDCPGLVANPSK
jgi:hypothetical protein